MHLCRWHRAACRRPNTTAPDGHESEMPSPRRRRPDSDPTQSQPSALRIQILARPLMIQPGLAADVSRRVGARDAAADAAGAAGCSSSWPIARRALLAVACDAVEQHRLGDLEAQVAARNPRRRCCGLVGRAAALEPPVIDPDLGVAARASRQSQAGAPDALVLPQVAARRIADGAMRDQQLTRRERAGIGLRQLARGCGKT